MPKPRPADYACGISGSETPTHRVVTPPEAQRRGRDKVRESERFIVPVKPGNQTRGDPVEGRRRRVAEPLEGNMAEAQDSGTVSTRQQRIAELAKQSLQMGFTSLNHYLDQRWLYEAYQRTRLD